MIPVDSDGLGAPPRKNGELVFDAPWQGRAFGMTIALLERQGLGWDAFRPHLITAIDARPDADYYEQLVEALSVLADEIAKKEAASP